MPEKLAISRELFLKLPYLRKVKPRVEVEYILEVISTRFNPHGATFYEIKEKLLAINESQKLKHIFKTALTADSLDSFITTLKNLLAE